MIAAYKETLYAQSLVWPQFKMQDAALSNVVVLKRSTETLNKSLELCRPR